MSWRDAMTLALKSAVRRPARTGLTVAAVALGTGLLVALALIAQTADTRVISQLGKGGPATAVKVAAAEPDPLSPDTDNPRPGPGKVLDDQAVAAIRRSPSVNVVVPVLAVRVEVVPPPRGAAIPTLAGLDPDRGLPQPYTDSAVGVDLTQQRNLPITVLAGQLPKPGAQSEVAVSIGYLDHLHLTRQQAVRVVGTEVELGAPQVTGSPDAPRIRARWTRAVIRGVVAQEIGDGNILAPIELTRAERAWQLGGTDGTDFGLPLPKSPYTGLVVVADGLDTVHSVRAQITSLGYATSAPEHLVATVQRYLHVVDIVLGSIGTIALVIAALGIADALLAAVRERRREIGVIKAIGGRDRDVLRWFLFEALVSGITGGIIGGLLGLATVWIVAAVVNGYLIAQGLDGVTLGSAPLLFGLVGIAGATILSMVAGAWPALRAARIPAREAIDSL